MLGSTMISFSTSSILSSTTTTSSVLLSFSSWTLGEGGVLPPPWFGSSTSLPFRFFFEKLGKNLEWVRPLFAACVSSFCDADGTGKKEGRSLLTSGFDFLLVPNSFFIMPPILRFGFGDESSMGGGGILDPSPPGFSASSGVLLPAALLPVVLVSSKDLGLRVTEDRAVGLAGGI